MITKVFLVIAILLICLIAWVMFLGDGGIIANTWNGIAESVNSTWKSLTGASTDIVPKWDTDSNLGEAQKNLDQAGSAGGNNPGP